MRLPALLTALAAAGALAVGIHWGTFAAGGSDSYCYVNEAVLFASGRTHLALPIAAGAPWRSADASFVPVGHRLKRRHADSGLSGAPGRSVGPGTALVTGPPGAVPICPPGLPVLMAIAMLCAGSDAAFYVVPLLGAAAIWLTFLLGRRLAGPIAGAASAILLACSPIFLYQIVQPMTDVPATAWWLAAIVLAARRTTGGYAAAGAAAGMALLTRPNLFPVGVVLTAFVAVTGTGRPHVSRFSARWYPLRAFVCSMLPFLLLLAWVQNEMYGSPMAVGYGKPGELYAAANILKNLRQYPAWLVATHTPFVLVGLFAVLIPARPPATANAAVDADARQQRELIWLCLLLSLTVLAAYLPYYAFQDWWYIRFLLPALPLLIVLSMTVLVHLTRVLPPRTCQAAVVVIVVAVGATWIRTARARLVFELQAFEARFVETGRFIGRELPPRAVVLTVNQSGSVMHYSGRPTLAWDTLQPDELDPALSFLSSRGDIPFLVLEGDEEPLFRARFSGHSRIGGLDWPPYADIRTAVRVRIYDPAGRMRYLRGEPIVTKRHWPGRAQTRG